MKKALNFWTYALWTLTYGLTSEGPKMSAHTQTAICALSKKTLGGGVGGQRAVISIYNLLAASISKDSLLAGKVLPSIIWEFC